MILAIFNKIISMSLSAPILAIYLNWYPFRVKKLFCQKIILKFFSWLLFIEVLLFVSFQWKNETRNGNTLKKFKYLFLMLKEIEISKEIRQMVILSENVFKGYQILDVLHWGKISGRWFLQHIKGLGDRL